MADLVKTVVDSLSSFLTGIGNGITSLFSSLLYQNVGDSKVLSDFAIYAMVILGIGLGCSLLYKVFGMIRHRG